MLASGPRLFTPRNKHLLWSFNKKNVQCVKAHLFCFLMFLFASAYISYIRTHMWMMHICLHICIYSYMYIHGWIPWYRSTWKCGDGHFDIPLTINGLVPQTACCRGSGGFEGSARGRQKNENNMPPLFLRKIWFFMFWAPFFSINILSHKKKNNKIVEENLVYAFGPSFLSRNSNSLSAHHCFARKSGTGYLRTPVLLKKNCPAYLRILVFLE